MGAWYCLREQVKAAVDIKDTARANAQIDRLIESASRGADKLCHRIFYPWQGTKYLNWPDSQSPTPWRLWLGEHEALSLSEVSAAGVVIPPVWSGSIAGYFLEPQASGPPYNRLEINRAASGSFLSGNTAQRTLALTGLWAGARLDERPISLLSEALDTTETEIDVADSSLLGVGSVLRIDTERMIVSERGWKNLSVTLAVGAPLVAKANDTVLTLSATTAAVRPGEVLLIDGERMTVNDVVGATCIVSRAVDGSVLAAHAAGAAVYGSRTLTVTRGALGTIAAAHEDAGQAYEWVPPGPINTLAVAETLNSLAQENSGYVRVIGSGENTRNASGAGLADVRRQAYDNYGRKARSGVI